MNVLEEWKSNGYLKDCLFVLEVENEEEMNILKKECRFIGDFVRYHWFWNLQQVNNELIEKDGCCPLRTPNIGYCFNTVCLNWTRPPKSLHFRNGVKQKLMFNNSRDLVAKKIRYHYYQPITSLQLLAIKSYKRYWWKLIVFSVFTR